MTDARSGEARTRTGVGRQIMAVMVGTGLAALGAVILGGYDLRGATAIVGFPLYGLAVAELVLAVGKRLALLTLPAVGAVVAGGLCWSLWISFGHFRNGYLLPGLSWAMVGVAAVAALAWGHPGPGGPITSRPATAPFAGLGRSGAMKGYIPPRVG